MFCANCGFRVSDSATFCTQCGNALEKPPAQTNEGVGGLSGHRWGSPASDILPEQTPAALAARSSAVTNSRSGSRQWRSWSRWASLAVVLSFFLPWFTVSCASVELTFSGFDLAIGPTINAGFGATQHLAASPLIWVVFLAALVGFAITFGSATGKTIGWTVLGSAIASLLVLILTWLSFSGQRSPYIHVTTNLGLWISLLGIGGMLYGGGTGVGQPEDSG